VPEGALTRRPLSYTAILCVYRSHRFTRKHKSLITLMDMPSAGPEVNRRPRLAVSDKVRRLGITRVGPGLALFRAEGPDTNCGPGPLQRPSRVVEHSPSRPGPGRAYGPGRSDETPHPRAASARGTSGPMRANQAHSHTRDWSVPAGQEGESPKLICSITPRRVGRDDPDALCEHACRTP